MRISDWISDVCSSDLSSLSFSRGRCYQYHSAKGLCMAAPTPEAIENARRKVEQAKARLQALEARAATLNRKQDARRKIILGGLLLDAAMKDPAWESRLNDLMGRISRDQDRSEEHTSELQSLMRISYAVFCLKKKKNVIGVTDGKRKQEETKH